MISMDSYRIDKQYIDLSIPFERFLQTLFGKKMRGIHGRCSESSWKKYLSKLSYAIEKSINKNVNTDAFHEKQLQHHIDHLKQLSKSKGIIDPEIIYQLTAIIFELLGGPPDHRWRSKVNQPDDYALNHLRSLHYSQTISQKAKTILIASNWKPFSDYHEYKEIEKKYLELYHYPEAFIAWYKEKYAKVYLELF